MAVTRAKWLIAECTTTAAAADDEFAGREHQIPPQRENLHTHPW